MKTKTYKRKGGWHVKNPLTLEERILLKEGLDLGLSFRLLGMHIGRSKSTVLRESKRLGEPRFYNPKKAQADFEKKQNNCGKKQLK